MAKKKEKTPVVTRDIPYVRCYNESGMIETSFGVFSKCYEILSPTRQKELTYSSKKVWECMKSIFLAFRDLSFRFVIHNSPTDKEEYLKTIQLSHGRSDKINACTDSYNALLKENVDVGHNNFTRSIYLCVSMEKNTPDEAVESFAELDQQIADHFASLYGYIAKPLTLEERLNVLYGIYHPGTAEKKGLQDGGFSIGDKKKPMKRAKVL